MQYKLWHLLVAFILGAVVVAGIVLAPGALTQGRLTLNSFPVKKVCTSTICSVVSNQFKAFTVSVNNRLFSIETKLGIPHTDSYVSAGTAFDLKKGVCKATACNLSSLISSYSSSVVNRLNAMYDNIPTP